MASQADVGEALARNRPVESIPSASNVRVVAAEDYEYDALVLSYGWAVIFARRTGGELVEFTGWQGYSPSTSTQMGKIRHEVKRVVGYEPEEVAEQPVHGNASSTHHRVQRIDGPEIK